MDLTTVFLGAAALVNSALLLKSMVRVRENQAAILESWGGKYAGTLTGAGIHFKNPFNHVADKLSTNVLSGNTDRAQTKFQSADGLFFNLPNMHYEPRLSDPKTFHYAYGNSSNSGFWNGRVGALLTDATRRELAAIDFDDISTRQAEISKAVIETTKEDMGKLGLTIERITLGAPEMNAEQQKNYNVAKAVLDGAPRPEDSHTRTTVDVRVTPRPMNGNTQGGVVNVPVYVPGA